MHVCVLIYTKSFYAVPYANTKLLFWMRLIIALVVMHSVYFLLTPRHLIFWYTICLLHASKCSQVNFHCVHSRVMYLFSHVFNYCLCVLAHCCYITDKCGWFV